MRQTRDEDVGNFVQFEVAEHPMIFRTTLIAKSAVCEYFGSKQADKPFDSPAFLEGIARNLHKVSIKFFAKGWNKTFSISPKLRTKEFVDIGYDSRVIKCI